MCDIGNKADRISILQEMAIWFGGVGIEEEGKSQVTILVLYLG